MRTWIPWLALVLAVAGCYRPGQSPPTDTDGGAAGPAPPAAVNPPEEVARLKGTWTGTVLLGDAPTQVTVEFTSDTIRIERMGTTRTSPYTLDPSQDPKWIDLEGSVKSDPPYPTTLGIYELDGDKLRISMGTPLKRPAALSGGKGSTVTAVYLLTRK